MKKGFTLIELLAVIVILAVISLITLPLIMGVIEESKVGAFKDSISLTFSAAELYEAREEVITSTGINVTELDMKNNNFKYGKIIKNASGDLEAVNVSDGNYCANGVLTNITVYDGECDPDAPICTYTVTSGTLGLNNYYTNSPTIEFVTSVSKSSGLYYGVGFVENYETIMLNEGESKTETSTITTNTDGIAINGYVKSGAGKTGTCSVDLKIDTNSPTVSTSVSGKDATITLGDNLGINGYAITTSAIAPTVWTSATGTSKVEAYTAITAGTYYAWVRDQAGNTAYSSFSIESTAFCAYTAGSYWNFDYNGAIQTFTVPCVGTYKLEVWGAQGGLVGVAGYMLALGSEGGYSVGNILLNSEQLLYVVVGGKGTDNPSKAESGTFAGGYNGGGSGVGTNSGGGGATHIAKVTGTLATIGYTSGVTNGNLLIVAGGAGGAGWSNTYNLKVGGTGGGTIGGDGLYATYAGYGGIGATQTAGGGNGTFGQGGNFLPYNGNGAGGGGGLYGGGGAIAYCGAGGGSGYLSSVLTSSSTTNGTRSGNGYATITLISLN